MLNKKLSVVVVGLQFGACFVPIWRDHPDVESVGIADLDDAQLNRVAEAHGVTRLYHSLDEVLALVDESAVKRAIRIGACNIYHGCVHNMLHEKSEEILQGLYKSASFVVQAIAFREGGSYIKRQEDLLTVNASLNLITIIKEKLKGIRSNRYGTKTHDMYLCI